MCLACLAHCCECYCIAVFALGSTPEPYISGQGEPLYTFPIRSILCVLCLGLSGILGRNLGPVDYPPESHIDSIAISSKYTV